ncbi:MAG: hypothetical protein QOK41_363, partial [Sphingomonadales bacterium]|nr:hypothetical protein [Sphingomonadales bacterium]
MDNYREHPSDFDLPASNEAPGAQDVAAAIGTDERRMHVRAYNHWVSLLDGRDFPSIEDLEPGDVEDFAPHSVLLDFTCGRDNPAVPYVGTSIRDECALDDDVRTIADVPSRSLLSRLTDHYMQIIANRAPVGFEAEFENPTGETICYRGILMPFSSDGESIDFIYGVINWKRDDAPAEQPTLGAQLPVVEFAQPEDEHEPVPEPVEAEPVTDEDESLELTDAVAPVAADEEQELPAMPETDALSAPQDETTEPAPMHFSWEDGPLHDEDAIVLPEIALDDQAGLADRLCAARETAESV